MQTGIELGSTSPFPVTLTILTRASTRMLNLYVVICNMEALGVMVKVMSNGLVAPSSNPGRDNCISLSANTLGKGMNPTLPPAMGN